MDASLLDKQNKLESMLQKGMVMIYLDARKPGVRLPAHLKAKARLTLNLSHRFSPADLTINAWGVRATLSFERRPFPVAVPWSAIFAIRSQVNMEFWLFPEDVPEAFLEGKTTAEVSPAAPNKSATFQLIHSAPEETQAPSSEAEGEKEVKKGEAEGDDTPPDKPQRPSHLKLLR